MNVVQILSGRASRYARKCADLDRASDPALRHTRYLARDGRVVDDRGIEAGFPGIDGKAIIRVYGTESVAPALLRKIASAWIADGEPPRSTLPWLRARRPFAIETPLRTEGANGWVEVPEAVLPEYGRVVRPTRSAISGRVVGSIRREGRPAEVVDSIRARIARFRDDVEWLSFDDYPTPGELAGLDAWVDPGTSPNDLDGGVAEAVCCGIPVVAARLPINRMRLDEGAAGFLVPPGDANEFVHALLAALFKPETVSAKLERAREQAAHFAPDHRAAAISRLYESLLRKGAS